MKIETIYHKGISQVNEDAFLVASPIFGVFDGVSGLEPYKNEQGQTGASIASAIARDVFAKSTDPLVETAVIANATIGQAMRDAGVDPSKKSAQWATTASVIKVNNGTFDWLKIGDSFILTVLRDGSMRLIGRVDDGDVEIMLLWKELALKQTENIRSVLNGHMLKARNTAENFGDLNGGENIERFLEHGTVELQNIAHIILFTDGLRIPKEDHSKPDNLEEFTDLFLTSGLQGIQDYVRSQEAADPQCWKYPRFKQHDDIAAVAVSF